MRLASASLHFGEEPPLTGSRGSGILFFSGCNLGCNFCQNHQISQDGMGREIGMDEFSDICLALQDAGAHNINLVTAAHFAPSVREGIALARSRGLALPVLWNSSGYESLATIELLADTVDVWLPDLKTGEGATSSAFFSAPDYPLRAKAAILRMAELSALRMEGPLLTRGLILRHLVLPGRLEESRDVFQWFADNLAGRALISVMSQYTPIPALTGRAAPDEALGPQEYEELQQMMEEFDLEGGFYQELVPGSDWLPDFAKTNPFSAELSRPLWHWRDGWVKA